MFRPPFQHTHLYLNLSQIGHLFGQIRLAPILKCFVDVIFGDFEFSDGYEDMEESWPYGTNVLLILLILVLTLFMMNVFIAVISSAYDDCLVEAAKYFEKLYIDVSFYKSRSKTMKRDVLKCYLKPIKKITSESLKALC